MRCRKAAGLLSDLVDGALDEAAGRAVEEHLGRCPSCAGARDRIERTRRLLLRARAARPGDSYWEAFWPRLERKLDAADEGRGSFLAPVCAFLSRQRHAGLLSPAPALAFLALASFSAFLVMQFWHKPGAGREAPASAPAHVSSAARGVSFPVSVGGVDIGGAGPRSGVDAVLCDGAGRMGIDEYVLQPAAFHRVGGGPRGIDFILSRPSVRPRRLETFGAY